MGPKDLGFAHRQILDDALGLPPSERGDFVRRALPAGETRDEALRLLEQVEGLGDFLEVDESGQGRWSPAAPTWIGGFRVIRTLGWGGMGVVYLAEQTAPRRLVAVKVLRVDISSPSILLRFQREGEVLARLSHRAIACVHETGVAEIGAGVQPFIVMEYVDGLPLNEFVVQKQIDRRCRVEIVIRIARAVQHAHNHGVLHRDLKPANILVREGAQPCVLDFGVARVVEDGAESFALTATGQVLGTLAYMAPEQAARGRADARGDQFALAAILYELLTGRLPFEVHGCLPVEALRIIADGECTPPDWRDASLKGDLSAILMMALASDPALRYPDVKSFAEDLGRWLDGRPVVASPPTAASLLLRSVGRNPRLYLGVSLLILLAGAIPVWMWAQLEDSRRSHQLAQLYEDVLVLDALREEADGLWPAKHETCPRLQAWLDRARRLMARLEDHKSVVRLLEQDVPGVPGTPSRLLVMARKLVRDMGQFELEIIEDVAEREEGARSLWARSVSTYSEQWGRAAGRVARDERFDGLDLVPQEGLVPLGPDPRSGLEEFALLVSGEIPVRDSVGGELIPTAEQALVMVLIPGGSAWIGRQSADPLGPNYESPNSFAPGGVNSPQHEGPPLLLELDPFFLSKYEMTQAQWIRMAGYNSNEWATGEVIRGIRITALHPAESFSWEQALQFLPRFDLTLPTEAQWEHAAGGGVSLPYVRDCDYSSLDGYVNWDSHSEYVLDACPVPADGYFGHSPVGAYLPNGYGLHDMLGNLWEYCLDVYKVKYHLLDHRPGDGLVVADWDGDVALRGRCFNSWPATCRLYDRDMARSDNRNQATGMRPSRGLRPTGGSRVRKP